MRSVPIVVNDLVLLTCTAMYFGTGWSLVLFSFPIRPRLTIDTYYDQFSHKSRWRRGSSHG